MESINEMIYFFFIIELKQVYKSIISTKITYVTHRTIIISYYSVTLINSIWNIFFIGVILYYINKYLSLPVFFKKKINKIPIFAKHINIIVIDIGLINKQDCTRLFLFFIIV